jgi:hypothetical protein
VGVAVLVNPEDGGAALDREALRGIVAADDLDHDKGGDLGNRRGDGVGRHGAAAAGDASDTVGVAG